MRLVFISLCALLTLFGRQAFCQTNDNVANKWIDEYQKVVNLTASVGHPEVGAPSGYTHRQLILCECMYDAWSSYQRIKAPTSGNSTIHSISPSPQNVAVSISYAAYQALTAVLGGYNSAVQKEIDSFLSDKLGYNLEATKSNSTTTAAGVGNKACSYVIARRSKDGSNRLGSEPFSRLKGVPYVDYTGYQPRNDPMPTVGRADCSKLRFVYLWQPERFKTANGSAVFVADDNYWGILQPFSKFDKYEFLAPQPPIPLAGNSTAWKAHVQKMLGYSAALNDTTKTLAWFFGPDLGASIIPTFVPTAARNANLNLDNSVKLYLVVAEAMQDAIIVEHFNKRFYDHARPTTAVQCTFNGTTVKAWKGPYLGVGQIKGETWTTYLPPEIVTFGHSEYISGGTLACGAVFTATRLFLANDTYTGPTFKYAEGALPLEAKIVKGQPGYIKGKTDVPNKGPATVGYAPAKEVVLNWKKWDEVVYAMADSRNFLGVHTRESVTHAAKFGKMIGQLAFEQATKLFRGQA
jgi:hypothetical protein